MKHCAKKLLGLAFALALCLAVGGTALAETPESANVPDTLPEQEMLAYEPNVTTAGKTTTTGDLATDGYTVTIPTTVEVSSEQHTGELEVTAAVKQMRTLNITLASDHKWNLQHESGRVQVGYSLKTKNPAGGESKFSSTWFYDEDGTITGTNKPTLSLIVGQKASGVSDITWSEGLTIPMTVQVKDTSKATMSGTYTDTVRFEFDLTKQCYTYIINVYGQKVELTNNTFNTGAKPAQKYQALKAVDMVGDANAPYTEQYVLEYGFDFNGNVIGGNPGAWQHKAPTEGETRKAIDGTEKIFTADDAADYALRWETLNAVSIDPAGDYATSKTNGDKIKTKTINLNLKRKWYWLDVNGVTNKDTSSGNLSTDGNQGSYIGCYVNIKVSDGTNWSDWFWYSYGDDYWGTFPYGTEFQLGLHRVKDGYAYDVDNAGNVAIYANGNVEYTQPGTVTSGDGQTHYRVYQGKLEGAPVDTALYTTRWGGNSHKDGSYQRYCYNPCYVDGITYYANGGTGGKEDTNNYHGAHTSFEYTEGMTLADPLNELTGCDFTAPAGKVFAGWSTTKDYTGQTLYAPGDPVSSVTWPTRPTVSHNDTLPDKDSQTKCRVLYAIWKKPYTVKVQFGDERGWTDWDEVNKSFPEKNQTNDLFDSPVTLGVTAYSYDNAPLTLSETENKTVWDALQTKITQKTKDIDSYARPQDVWQLKDAYTITELPANGEVTIKIKRKRYLLNVIPALQKDDGNYTAASNATEAELYGKFKLDSCGIDQTVGGKVSYYQSMRNYGNSYRIYDVVAKPGYRFVAFYKVPSGGGFPTQVDGTGNLTGQNTGISYFGGGSTTYEGDTIYVMFKKDTVTFEYNGGTSGGESRLVLNYDDTICFPKVLLTPPKPSVDFVGWSTEKNPTSDDEIFKLASYDPNDYILPGTTLVSSKVTTWPDKNNKVLYAVWRTGSKRAPAKKALTLRYHANFDPTEEVALDRDPNPLLEDMDEAFGFDPDPLPEDVLDPTVEEVKTVTYKPDENVVLRHCMFKRAGYVFVGWNTEPDGTGKLYRVTGVPVPDWAAGDTVDLYAQWKKPEHLNPVDDSAPQLGGTTPAPTPQPGGADPAPQPGGMDDAFGVDPHLGGMDDAFGVDPAAQPKALDDAFGVDPAQPDALDDAFGV